MTDVNPGFSSFLDRARSQMRPLILDGAVGTELDNRGANTDTPLWSGMAALLEPELLAAIHSDYVRAGAEIVIANTFRTTRRAFEKSGAGPNDWRVAAVAAVRIARQAAGKRAIVAGSVAPLEDCFSPWDAPRYQSAYGEHRLLCKTLVASRVDILWLETFGTLEELEAAMDAAVKEGRGALPFTASVTTTAKGDLISGESLAAAAALAEKKGAAAFSVNCIPTNHVPVALEILKGATTLPIGVYANLGVPESNQDWKESAYLSPDAYVACSRNWNVSLVGGCCGSNPAHIEALRDAYAV